jgi:hypothetical protein
MIQKDYILRPLFILIEEIVSKFSAIKFENVKDQEQYINNLYLKYFKKSKTFFIEKDIVDLFNDKSISSNELNLLAEIFYLDALIQKDKTIKISLFKKAVAILKHISKSSDTYSFERENRINLIENKLSL